MAQHIQIKRKLLVKVKTHKNKEFSFDLVYDNSINLEAPTNPRPPVFRLSDSPFCPLKTLQEWRDHIFSENIWSFRGDFYCDIGTAVHNALQKWIPRANPGIFIGNWRCKHCCSHPYLDNCEKCTKNCKFYKEALVGPQRCPVCGNYMAYEEFQYLLPNVPASGHSDGLMLFDPKKVMGLAGELNEDHLSLINKMVRDKNADESFPAYVLEFKTTGKTRVLNMTEPLPHHKAQASMYVGCCHEILGKKYGLYNIDVKGVIIKYIARDSPDMRSKDFEVIIENNAYYKYNKSMIYKAVKGFYHSNLDKFTPEVLPCSKEAPFASFYKECPYEQSCEKFRSSRKNMNDVLEKSRNKFIKVTEEMYNKFGHTFKT